MNRLSTRTFILGAVVVLALAAAPVFAAGAGSSTVAVNGSVTDASGHGWPLYARIEMASGATDPVVVYSDPITGAYAANLADGTAYAVTVTAISSGYVPGNGQVVTAGSGVVANWTLSASAVCAAPGYAAGTFSPVLSESFDGGTIPAGWALDTQGGLGWAVMSGADECGQFDGNRTGGSGAFAILNSNCPGFNFDDAYLVTPAIDLSSVSNAGVRWANDFIDTGVSSTADVDVSIDGGATWVNVWHADRTVSGPGVVTADMSFAAGHANVRARFHYLGFWGWWWQVDDVQVGPFACAKLPGGMVVGAVRDLNTAIGVNGAIVADTGAGGAQTTTSSTPGQGDGYYSLFAGGAAGSRSFSASAEKHTPVTLNVDVVLDAAVRLDFALPAGLLDASPRPLSAVVSPGGTQSLTLDVVNSGSGDGSFTIHEVDAPPSPAANAVRPEPQRVLSAEDRLAQRERLTLHPRFDGTSAATAELPQAFRDAPATIGAGRVVGSFQPGLAGAYGLAYDTDSNRIWLTNPDAPAAGLNGDGLDHEFQPDGTATGETIDMEDAPSAWQGDGTYDARTGMIWRTGVSFRVDDPPQCIFEIDPVAKTVTGKRICGPWGNYPGVVGLAYDYATDTFYVGDQLGVITHVDTAGTVLDSTQIAVQISGLAYNPTTRHLYIQTFSLVPFDIYVVDPHDSYRVLSGFAVTSGGVPVLNGGGVSLEADCLGHLWLYDIFQARVLEVDSGETGWCVDDIPWLSEDPVSATIPGVGAASHPSGTGNTLPVTVSVDSAGLLPGLRLRSLVFTTDTPAPVAPVPVALTVLFSDVPEGSFAWNYIHGAAGAGVMPGCNPYAPAYAFCPSQIVTRRSMAAFIERAAHGALTPPPVYMGRFDDVLVGSFNSDYVEGLVQDGITAGCSVAPALYCPDVPVTRAQMAVFVWKSSHGAQPPPACAGVFADVPCPGGFAADYIEGIYADGVTAGCGGGNYCPNAGITNAQMAVYLVKAFALPYLP